MATTKELRELTPAGIQYARKHLARIREDPSRPLEAPDRLLFQSPYSEHFADIPLLVRRPFPTRRDAVVYLTPRLDTVKHRIIDRSGVWSWLGMFYLPVIAPRKQGEPNLSPRDETFVMFNEGRSAQRRYRHYLWTAWRLGEQHPEADFLLDAPFHDLNDLAYRAFAYSRIFNSLGVLQLLIDLYTEGKKLKPKYSTSKGGLRHLIVVLEQLECTYDIYGMEASRIKEILPSDFEQWVT